MLEFLPAIGNVLALALAGVTAKKVVGKLGVEKALVYTYLLLSALLLLGAFVFQIPLTLPHELLPAYLLQITIGSIAVFGLFKALESGKASVVLPLTRVHTLFVLVLGTILLGETLSPARLAGSLLLVLSALLIAFENLPRLRLEKGIIYLALTIAGWGYYFTFIRQLVDAMGVYPATVFLETGIGALLVAYFLLRGVRLSWADLTAEKSIYLRSGFLALGSFLYSLSVSMFGAILTASIAAATPMAEVLFSYLWLKEKLSMYRYVAVAGMVAGLLIIAIG